MPGVELSVSWKGRLASASLHVDIDESTTCRDLLEQLVNEGWGRKGACHLVERWQRCERPLSDGELVLEAMERCEGRVCLKCEEGRSVRRGERRRGRGRGTHYLRGRMTLKKLYLLRHHLKMASISLSTETSTIWLEKLAQGAHLMGSSARHPLQPFKERLAELKQSNLQLSTEISELNIQTGDLAGELHTLREEGCDLSDGVRCVEEDVRVRKWEKERELRSRVADLQTEAIKLRRELETRNKLNCAQSSKLETLKETLAEKRRAAGLCEGELVRLKTEINQTRAAAQSHDLVTSEHIHV